MTGEALQHFRVGNISQTHEPELNLRAGLIATLSGLNLRRSDVPYGVDESPELCGIYGFRGAEYLGRDLTDLGRREHVGGADIERGRLIDRVPVVRLFARVERVCGEDSHTNLLCRGSA